MGREKDRIEEGKNLFLKTLEDFQGLASWREPSVAGEDLKVATITTTLVPIVKG